MKKVLSILVISLFFVGCEEAEDDDWGSEYDNEEDYED